jgi:hypothetical protein
VEFQSSSVAALVKSVNKGYIKLIKRLIDRLEHLSADSTYAHRASGLRGSLLRWIERLESGEHISRIDRNQLDQLLEYGFDILERAAKEVGGS